MKNKSGIAQFFIICFLLLSVLAIISGCDPRREKTYVIGIVNPNPDEAEGEKGFINSMANYGYVEGENVSYIKIHKELTERELTAIKAKKPDLIFSITTPATKMLRELTAETGIPVVFIVYDPVGSGVVESLVRPGGNLTGVRLSGSIPKTMEWLLAIAPRTKRIFVPIKFDTGAARLSLDRLIESAAKLDIRTTVSEVGTSEELQASLNSMPGDIDAVFVLHSIFVTSQIEHITDIAVKRKVPVISSGHEHYKKGAIISYGPRDDRTGAQAARLADSILHGAPPAGLPVETSEFFLGINLQTAQLSGITVPDDILELTDFIVR